MRELPVATEMAGVDMRLKPRAGRVPGATNMVFLPLGGGQRRGLDHGCEFLLVLDDGYFSENKTFLLTQGTVPHSFKVRLAD